MKTGLLVTSRNNYNFMEKFWIANFHRENYITLNIDEDSSEKEKKLGKYICKKYNIIYLDRDKRGMHNNLVTASEYFEPLGIEWLIWFQHDCWPLQNNFISRFDELVSSGKMDKFGTVGFNVLATDIVNNYDKQIKLLEKGEKPFGVLARSPLSCFSKWYSGISSKTIKAIKNYKAYKKPFAVESPAWVAIGMNIKKFKEYIKPSDDYQFFHAWDDIAFQFLNSNIYNIALPDFYVAHRPDLKPECNLPFKSVKAAKNGDDTFHGKWGHLEVWKKRWGWDWENPKTFEIVRERYKNSLLNDFYGYDPEKGPIKEFDLL